jgi:uncharacterized protein (DUF1501 family)
MTMDRRTILKSALALTAWAAPIRFAFASVPGEKRFVVIILRGALDGLAVAPPHGDPDYKAVRGVLAIDTVHDLDGQFGLHPSLTNMKTMWGAKELVVFQNIASPYRARSHFDGQAVLESGGDSHAIGDGWLNRALKPLGLGDGNGALAIAASPPLMLQGPARVSSWMPQVMPEPDMAFLKRVSALYSKDAELRSSLDRAIDTEAKANAAMDDRPRTQEQMAQRAGGYGDLTPLFAGAGRLLARDDGPRIAVLDASGWDTHVNEGAGDGALARRLRALDAGLDAMKTALGPVWKKTAVVMATEFGRTVAPNGGGGTDHGTAGAAFLFGGSVRGGTVQAEWTGLKPAALKDGRDQPPRTDLRALFKGVLADHMGVTRRDLDTNVFPDSAGVAPSKALFA